MSEIKGGIFGTLKKYANIKSIAIILIVGVALMCIPSGKKKDPQEKVSPAAGLSAQEYVSGLEARLAAILSTAEGIADVSVMITVSDDGVNRFEQNRSEQNGAGSTELAMKSQGQGAEEPVLTRRSSPTVTGVIVSALGADSPAVRADIKEAVSAVLDVGAHRIAVLSK